MPSFPPTLIGTRLGLHALSEQVVCAVRYAAVGRVGLTPAPDGVVTPPFDGRTVGVRGLELVDTTAAEERRAPVTTLRAAARFFAVALGSPPLWTPTTTADPDAPLDLDLDAVGTLAAWFALVGGALAAHAPDAPATLWPEHFDLAATVGDATYGGSPGDGDHPEPYLYVTAADHPADAFWNEPFGASRPGAVVAGADDAVAFFAEADSRLGS